LNEGRIADVLVQQLEGIDKTCTFFNAVQRLPPAHFVATQSDRSQQQRYWRLQPGLIAHVPATDAQWAAGLTEVLEHAVGNHLAGGDRVGCMLSGGLDSSTLAVIARDQLAAAGNALLPTFSSIGNDPDCLETQAIRAMLELPGFAPTLIDPDALETMRAELIAAVQESEEPFDHSMLLIHAQYMSAARNKIDALMDGIDGDTLFSEAGGLKRQLRAGHWLAAWRNARGDQRIYPGLPAWKSLAFAARSALTPDWLRQRTRQQRLGLRTRDCVRTTVISPDFAARIDLQDRLQRFDGWQGVTPRDVVSQALQSLDQTYTTCGIERYHRVAAWHGVDPRHPFSDRKVLEFCVNLPDAQRMANGWSKYVLRRAMQSRLPETVCWRLGKQHLGWSLIEQLLLKNAEDVHQCLAAYRNVLIPYVDMHKLDLALRQWQQPKQYAARNAVFDTLTLGGWLAHRASAGG
jgi:asparagine synthase (glutamine-hydrolysing)